MGRLGWQKISVAALSRGNKHQLAHMESRHWNKYEEIKIITKDCSIWVSSFWPSFSKPKGNKSLSVLKDGLLVISPAWIIKANLRFELRSQEEAARRRAFG